MKANTIKELTESLFDIYNKIDDDKISLNKAKQQTNTANSILRSIQVSLDAINTLGFKEAEKLLK